MDYPTRRQKRKPVPDADRGDDRTELKLAEYAAPFGEEWPVRIATDEPSLRLATHGLRPERGRLH
jgi:hypothetical protein